MITRKELPPTHLVIVKFYVFVPFLFISWSSHYLCNPLSILRSGITTSTTWMVAHYLLILEDWKTETHDSWLMTVMLVLWSHLGSGHLNLSPALPGWCELCDWTVTRCPHPSQSSRPILINGMSGSVCLRTSGCCYVIQISNYHNHNSHQGRRTFN